MTLVSLFFNADYRVGVWGCAAWYALSLVWFALWGRRTLVYSPEEEFAVRQRGSHGLE